MDEVELGLKQNTKSKTIYTFLYDLCVANSST